MNQIAHTVDELLINSADNVIQSTGMLASFFNRDAEVVFDFFASIVFAITFWKNNPRALVLVKELLSYK